MSIDIYSITEYNCIKLEHKEEKIMFCLKCGKEIDDTAMACPFCGCATENSGMVMDVGTDNTSAKSAETLSNVGIALGGIGIVMAWLLAILGYLFGGGALAVAILARGKDRESKKARIALYVSIAALGCSVINSIIGMIVMS